MYVCLHIRTYIRIVCMYERMCVCVCGGEAGANPGFLGPKAYTILEAILRKRIKN